MAASASPRSARRRHGGRRAGVLVRGSRHAWYRRRCRYADDAALADQLQARQPGDQRRQDLGARGSAPASVSRSRSASASVSCTWSFHTVTAWPSSLRKQGRPQRVEVIVEDGDVHVGLPGCAGIVDATRGARKMKLIARLMHFSHENRRARRAGFRRGGGPQELSPGGGRTQHHRRRSAAACRTWSPSWACGWSSAAPARWR